MNLKINHRTGVSNITYFNDFSLKLQYDSVASTFGFSFYYDPLNKQHAEMACVSHFHDVLVEHNGERLLTGRLLNQSFSLDPSKDLTHFGGYSLAGVIEDCEIPPSLYPLQSDGMTLSEIAKRITDKFGLRMIIDPTVAEKMNKAIPVTTAKETQSIKSYLTELCVQRGIIMSHDASGNMLFTRAKTGGSPIFHVEKGLIATNISLSFNGQGIHSHITVQKQASSDGGNAGEYTIENPYCSIVYRPTVITQNSGDDNTIEDAAKLALAAELRNIVLTVETDRWEVNGKLLRPNNLITVYCPDVFLYKKTTWFIQAVEFKGDEKSNTATLTCVLPECYNSAIPKNIFVNPHENLPRF